MSINILRIESTFKRELSLALNNSTNDFVRSITITDIDLTSQKEYARVYFMAHRNIEKTHAELKRAIPYINKVLSKKMSLKRLPKIEFIEDTSFDYAKNINKKIEEINK